MFNDPVLKKMLDDMEAEEAAKTPEQRDADSHSRIISENEFRETIGKNYGKPDSWCLARIRELGFNPIFITILAGEQTFVFETVAEADAAMKAFQEEYNTNEGWWYGLKDGEHTWVQTAQDYKDSIGKIYDLRKPAGKS